MFHSSQFVTRNKFKYNDANAIHQTTAIKVINETLQNSKVGQIITADLSWLKIKADLRQQVQDFVSRSEISHGHYR